MIDAVATLARVFRRPFRAINDARLAVGRGMRAGAVGHGARSRDRVALTFDDGPDPRWTPAIIEILANHGARGTFFFLGQAMEQHAELARSVANDHQVGTHLYSHDRALTSSADAMLADIRRAVEAHERVLGVRPTALRFPYGKSGPLDAAAIERLGLIPYHWTFSSHDSRAESPRPIVNRFSAMIGAGDIVLLHDGVGPGSRLGPGHRNSTVAALPQLLAELERRGLEAVTLDELFAD